jgi:hypothetical protein
LHKKLKFRKTLGSQSKNNAIACNNYLSHSPQASALKYEINFNVDFKRIANVASGNAQTAVVKKSKKEMKLHFINLIYFSLSLR